MNMSLLNLARAQTTGEGATSSSRNNFRKGPKNISSWGGREGGRKNSQLETLVLKLNGEGEGLGESEDQHRIS